MLTKYLGWLIKDLDQKQLSIGMWGGGIELHDLEIKGSALEFLKLPVAVKSGFIGTLKLKVF